jgi:hypothetical protein
MCGVSQPEHVRCNSRAEWEVGRTIVSRGSEAKTHLFARPVLIEAPTDGADPWRLRQGMRFGHGLDLTPPRLDLHLARIVALRHPRNQADGGHAWLRDGLYQPAADT